MDHVAAQSQTGLIPYQHKKQKNKQTCSVVLSHGEALRKDHKVTESTASILLKCDCLINTIQLNFKPKVPGFCVVSKIGGGKLLVIALLVSRDEDEGTIIKHSADLI